MVLISSDIWPADRIPRWDAVLKAERAKLHLYGKKDARPGRKMGHINCLGDTIEAAESLLAHIREALS